ncbi:MAG: SpaA isopeptide-forming pilin-related protein [Coriobacteriia bacterium]|nr:SpaA isopeptide-forming pilin-related protein [Coriobacteriia bacterium]
MGEETYTSTTAVIDADSDNDGTFIRVSDEKIRATLTKKGGDGKLLEGAVFALVPVEGSAFAPIEGDAPGGAKYEFQDDVLVKVTLTTGAEGLVNLPEGLLVVGGSYTLTEVQAAEGYYLSNAARVGATLTVAKDGTLTLTQNTGENVSEEAESPYSVNSGSEEQPAAVPAIAVENPQAAVFDLTKKTTGNRIKHKGAFTMKVTVYEPDGSPAFYRNDAGKLVPVQADVALKAGDTWQSTDDLPANAIPVDAQIVVREDRGQAESAKLSIGSSNGTAVLQDPVDGDSAWTFRAQVKKASGAELVLTNYMGTANDPNDDPDDPKKKAPQTGDDWHPLFWQLMIAFAVLLNLGIEIAVRLRRRREMV